MSALPIPCFFASYPSILLAALYGHMEGLPVIRNYYSLKFIFLDLFLRLNYLYPLMKTMVRCTDFVSLYIQKKIYNIISGTAGGRKFQKRKHIEPIEMERLWFDVTHLFEELLLAFD